MNYYARQIRVNPSLPRVKPFFFGTTAWRNTLKSQHDKAIYKLLQPALPQIDLTAPVALTSQMPTCQQIEVTSATVLVRKPHTVTLKLMKKTNQ